MELECTFMQVRTTAKSISRPMKQRAQPMRANTMMVMIFLPVKLDLVITNSISSLAQTFSSPSARVKNLGGEKEFSRTLQWRKKPESVNSNQGCLQVNCLVHWSISGKDNPLTKLIQRLYIDGIGLPEHLHLVPIPGVVNGDGEVEGRVFHLGENWVTKS